MANEWEMVVCDERLGVGLGVCRECVCVGALAILAMLRNGGSGGFHLPCRACPQLLLTQC